MWFDFATIFTVLAVAAISITVNQRRMSRHFREIDERIALLEELLVSVENYTRVARHTVANLHAAMALVFPEVMSRLVDAVPDPIDLDEKEVDK